MVKKSLLIMMLLALFAPWAAFAQDRSQLNEGFESTTFPPTDWTTIHVSGSNSWARYTGYKHTGDASAYAHWASDGHENYLITPQLAPAVDEALTFYVSAQSYAGTTLKVELSTTTATAAAFTTTLATYTTGSSGTIGTTSPSTFVEKTINLSSYVGQQIYIAFHVIDSNGGDVIIDDITGVTIYVPAYPKPSNVRTGTVTDQTAEILWDAPQSTNSITGYAYQYGHEATDEWSAEATVTTTSANISGLMANTEYDFRVKALYEGNHESDYATTTFTTACGINSTFPWTEDFTGLTAGIPSCWDNEDGTTTSASYKWSYYNAGHDAAPCLRFNSYSNSNGNTNFLKTPTFNFPAGTVMQLVFWYKNPTGGPFDVYISTDGGSTYTTELATGLTGASNWTKKEINLNNQVGAQNVVIVFKGTSNYGSGDAYIYLDDVTVKEAPSCLPPTGLAADASTTSAELSWIANSSETEWTVYYKKTTDENYTAVPNVDENPYTLSGLTASTNYQYYVVANCSAENESDPSEVFPFATECGVVAALGYSENFDSYTAGTGVLPTCWNSINTCSNSSYSAYPYIYANSTYTTYANSAPNCLRFYSYYSSYTNYDPQPQYAILPQMTSLNGIQVTLKAKGYNNSTTFKVGTMSDPADASTFAEITNSANPSVSSSTYREFTYIVPANTTAKYLAIMMEAANSSTSTKGVYIDDIVITEAPTCFQPQSLAVTEGSVTAHEATLTWTPNVNGNETAWVLQIATKNDFSENLQSFDVNTTPTKALTDLTDGTQYFARVKPDCDTEGTLWSTTYTFTTPIACPAPTGLAVSGTTGSQTTLNWTGNSDSYDVMYRTAAYVDGVYEEFDVSGVPSGWTRYSGLVDAVIAGTTTLSTVSGYWNTNTYALGNYNMALNIYGTSCKYWLVTPEFNLSQNLSFDLALTDFGNADPIEDNTLQSDDRFVVLIYADEAWHILREWNNTGSDYVYNTISYTGENVTINLSAYQGKDVKIAFYGESTNPSSMENTGGDNQLHIDNVHCGIPHEAGQWITHNEEPVTATTYTLDGLDPETDYDVKVKSNCDGETSHETAVVSFTTEAACMVPNTVTVVANSVTAHAAQLSWNSDASAWEICLNDDEAHPVAANTNPFTLTGLSEATAYTAKVRSNCNGSYSDWSSEVSFTTPLACPAPTGLAVSGTTGSQTTLTWTGESDSYEVYYGEEESATVANADFETGDFSQASFTNSTTYPWTVVENGDAHYAKSGGYHTGYATSDLTLQVVGPGTVQFRAKVSSEGGYDYGRFLINGTQKVNVSGAGSWIDYEFELAAGNNTLVWRYYKDSGTDSNDDCFYVDDINITGMVVNTWNLHGNTAELTYTLDGLDAETNYQVKVKSACTNETGHETAAVSFTTEAACMVPNELAAVPATTTADLSWTSDASAWQISTGDDTNPISLTSETTGVTINGTTVSYTLTDLTSGTTYTFKVRAVCDGTPSEWSETMSFTTECEPITITAETPYTQDFESPVVTATYNSSNADLIKVPNCWDNYHADAASGSNLYLKPHLIKSDAGSSGYNYSSPASQVLYFYGNGYGYAALPEFTNALNTLQITFKWAVESASYGTLTIGYITDADVNYNTYTVIKTMSTTTAKVMIQADPINLSNLPANATRLVFRWWYSSWYGANIDDVVVSLLPTFTKTINAYGTAGYYLIASPVGTVDPTNVTNMITTDVNDYALYRFNQSADNEWENYKANSFNLESGKGYLYGNSNDVTLTFVGTPLTETEVDVDLVYDEEAYFDGWNLVGNPFTEEATINKAAYTLPENASEGQTALVPVAEGTPIQAMEGVFVFAEGADESVTFSTTAKGKSQNLNLNLTKGQGLIDRAIVSFGEGSTLPKFQLFGDHTKVYIPQEGKDYAVVSATEMGEMPVSFKAEENGTYTLSFTAEEVSFNYLHLIDNMTGTDVDLLQAPSYTFNATTTDYSSRFKLVFATGSNNDSDSFAFFSNGNWIIGNEGEATLQVIDVTGRILSSETVNGSVSKAINAAPGVYMLRLINGENVKVQKIVVR